MDAAEPCGEELFPGCAVCAPFPKRSALSRPRSLRNRKDSCSICLILLARADAVVDSEVPADSGEVPRHK